MRRPYELERPAVIGAASRSSVRQSGRGPGHFRFCLPLRGPMIGYWPGLPARYHVVELRPDGYREPCSQVSQRQRSSGAYHALPPCESRECRTWRDVSGRRIRRPLVDGLPVVERAWLIRDRSEARSVDSCRSAVGRHHKGGRPPGCRPPQCCVSQVFESAARGTALSGGSGGSSGSSTGHCGSPSEYRTHQDPSMPWPVTSPGALSPFA
jgi:hypothetical protein